MNTSWYAGAPLAPLADLDEAESCACCWIGNYEGDLDADDVSCPNCGHSPEEHVVEEGL